MKFFVLFTLALPLLSFRFINKSEKVIFFGDSITEAGVRPGGYITRLGELLATKGQADRYELIGAGISGNKVYDLYLRLEEDVLAKKPDLVYIYVGVNDVWHKRTFGTGTDAPKFQQFYVALIKKIRAAGSRIVVCTPACIGEKTDCTNALDGELNQYSQIIRDIAQQYNCSLVDLRQSVMTYNQQHNPDNLDKGILTTDGVHLNDAGNQLVAEEMMKVIGQ